MRQILFFLVISILLSSCIPYHFSESDIFRARKVSKLNEGVVIKAVKFKTSDDIEISGRFAKVKNAKGTILYFGGNGFSLRNRSTNDVINFFTNLQINLMLIDYRGYGLSEGSPTIQGIYKDSEAAYKYLRSRDDVDSTKIILYGHSLGAFVATNLAKKYTFSGLVLEGAISNATEMKDAALQAIAPWYIRWLVTIDADSSVLALNNLEQVKEIKIPLLVITGEKDDLAPPAMGREIMINAKSKNKKFVIIPNWGHKSLWLSKDGSRSKFNDVLSKFLDSVL